MLAHPRLNRTKLYGIIINPPLLLSLHYILAVSFYANTYCDEKFFLQCETYINISARTQKIDILLLMVVEKCIGNMFGKRCSVVSVYLLLVTLYPISMSMSKMSLPRLYLCALEIAYIHCMYLCTCTLVSYTYRRD